MSVDPFNTSFSRTLILLLGYWLQRCYYKETCGTVKLWTYGT